MQKVYRLAVATTVKLPGCRLAPETFSHNVFINRGLLRTRPSSTFLPVASWKIRGISRHERWQAARNQNGVEKKRPGGSLKGNSNSEVKGFGQEVIDTP